MILLFIIWVVFVLFWLLGTELTHWYFKQFVRIMNPYIIETNMDIVYYVHIIIYGEREREHWKIILFMRIWYMIRKRANLMNEVSSTYNQIESSVFSHWRYNIVFPLLHIKWRKKERKIKWKQKAKCKSYKCWFITYASQYGNLLNPLYVFIFSVIPHSWHLKHVLCHVCNEKKCNKKKWI